EISDLRYLFFEQTAEQLPPFALFRYDMPAQFVGALATSSAEDGPPLSWKLPYTMFKLRFVAWRDCKWPPAVFSCLTRFRELALLASVGSF
ncbi:MAG: hypothetical protein ACTS41_01820, partial [Candidatus Hodgkinia cicadicola]